jgi:hypothetical protein
MLKHFPIMTGLVWLYLIIASGLAMSAIACTPITADLPSPSPTTSVSQVAAPAIARAKENLSRSLNVPTTTFNLVSVQATVWQDGCLGLGQANEICAQRLVDGWRIELTDGKTTWTYRSDQTGQQVRMEVPANR